MNIVKSALNGRESEIAVLKGTITNLSSQLMDRDRVYSDQQVILNELKDKLEVSG